MFQAPGPFPPQPANPYFQAGPCPAPQWGMPPAPTGAPVQYIYVYVPYPAPMGFGAHHGPKPAVVRVWPCRFRFP